MAVQTADGLDGFLTEVLSGLRSEPKRLSSKYFYDKRGSELFDEICELDEYYVTRTEASIIDSCAEEIGRQLGERVMLVEFGSGSSTKTRILLDHLVDPAAYVPVDISGDHLQEAADDLTNEYPAIEVLPVCADFTQRFELPEPSLSASHVTVFFPGSTIGNFAPSQAQALLKQIVELCGQGGGLLVGIDLQKDPKVLEAAYNDREGVTAEFNLNLLHRINGELDADFEVDEFSHLSEYNDCTERIETFLVSQRDQKVQINGHEVAFSPGEKISTEYSQKYTIDGFAEFAEQAGLTLRRAWTDENDYFALLHLMATT